jgi:hypothetical protein
MVQKDASHNSTQSVIKNQLLNKNIGEIIRVMAILVLSCQSALTKIRSLVSRCGKVSRWGKVSLRKGALSETRTQHAPQRS